VPGRQRPEAGGRRWRGASSLNRGGAGRLTSGVPAQWRAAAVESVGKEIQIRLNSNDLKLFQTLTTPKMPFLSSKILK
jgi:hypothetical protein